MVALCAAWYLHVGYTQFAGGKTFLADVGVFHALVSGPLHGTFLRTPLAPFAEGNYFGIHFQPALFLLTPFHLIHDSPVTLVSCFGLALALAAIPLAMLAREVTGDAFAGLAFAALYLLNHFTLSIHLAQHPESLAMPWIFMLFLAMRRGRATLAYLSLALALSVKQDFALWLMLWCLASAIKREGRRLSLGLAAFCVGWFILAEAVRHLCGAAEFERLGMTPTSRFASMGETRPAILLHMLTHPVEILLRVIRPPLALLIVFAGPWLLLDWKRALAGVAAAVVFLAADDWAIKDLLYYYSYAALPLLLGASVGGYAILANLMGPRRHMLARGILIVYTLGACAASLAIPTRTDDLRHRPFPISDRARMIGRVAELIPQNGVVAAHYNYYTRVPARRDLFPLREWSLKYADYLFMSFDEPAPDITREEGPGMAEEINSARWELLYEEGGVVILGRVSPP